MATYLELFALTASPALSDLRKRILVAIAVKAQLIAASATPTAAAVAWARDALADPQHYEKTVLNYVLADNLAATTTQIETASDTLVQTAVNEAVDKLLGV